MSTLLNNNESVDDNHSADLCQNLYEDNESNNDKELVNNQINTENNITHEQKTNWKNQNIRKSKQNHFLKQSHKNVQKSNEQKINLRNWNIPKRKQNHFLHNHTKKIKNPMKLLIILLQLLQQFPIQLIFKIKKRRDINNRFISVICPVCSTIRTQHWCL